MESLRSVPELWSGCDRLPRHRHREPYAAVILSGGYVEAGDEGRRTVGPGDVLVHGTFDAHLDRFSPGDTRILNLPLPVDVVLPARGTVGDADALVRAAVRDAAAAVAMLRETLVANDDRERDWPDLLAGELASRPPFCLGAWASRHGLAPATVSRGFRLAYGTTPMRYRAEWRARRAWRAIVSARAPMAQLALDCGFADQAHMSRAVAALTGRPPGAWRRPA